jgi:hypothetical protein
MAGILYGAAIGPWPYAPQQAPAAALDLNTRQNTVKDDLDALNLENRFAFSAISRLY